MLKMKRIRGYFYNEMHYINLRFTYLRFTYYTNQATVSEVQS